MAKVRHRTRGSSSGGAVSDAPYSASWDGVTGIAPSKNTVYDRIQLIGYVPGNIAYQNPVGGNDSTAVLGNVLRPFLTIGAAIAALGTSTSSALVISGYNMLDDTNAPYGLKAPGSYYDVIAQPGCRVDYYGTYGAYISDASTFGSIYGTLELNAYSATYSGSVNGVNNWAVNIGVATTPKRIECYNITNQNTSVSSGNIRVGLCTGTAVTFDISGRILAKGGISLFMDTNSRVFISSIALLQNTSQFSGMLKIVDPTDLQLNNIINSQSYANYLGYSQPYVIQINDSVGTGNIKFDNCNITAQETTDANFKVIEIVTPLASLPNLSFKRCDVKSRFSTIYNKSGYSFYSATNVSFKMRDVSVEQDLGGAGVITNLISTGTGLMLEPNL
jgi:hypothetical protein